MPFPFPPKKLPVLNTHQVASIGRVSQEPWTKDWYHLRDLSKGQKKVLFGRMNPKPELYKGMVPVQTRIKQWNIIPGDLIRVRGQEDTIREVFGINKFKNLVYLKGGAVRSVLFTFSKDTKFS